MDRIVVWGGVKASHDVMSGIYNALHIATDDTTSVTPATTIYRRINTSLEHDHWLSCSIPSRPGILLLLMRRRRRRQVTSDTMWQHIILHLHNYAVVSCVVICGGGWKLKWEARRRHCQYWQDHRYSWRRLFFDFFNPCFRCHKDCCTVKNQSSSKVEQSKLCPRLPQTDNNKNDHLRK